MRGHEGVVRMRLAGEVPSVIFMDDFPCDEDEINWYENGGHVVVCTDGDVIALLDLRFLVNLRVALSSESVDRAKALFAAAKEAGAEVVSAVHVNAYGRTDWHKVWVKGDPDG